MKKKYKKAFHRIFNITNKHRYKIIDILGFRIKINRFKFKYPIDLVYCWVDGNDTNWQQEKLLWQKKLNIPTENNVLNPCRFIDNEELRYSLRSVGQNAFWINHIYIITNGQIPAWLDTTHPKITIINHKDIMPVDALPTFNSEAIETCIANIPNLSEHFLYANDDFFIYKTITPTYFFNRKGLPIVRLAKQNWSQEIINKQLYLTNIIHSANLVKECYGIFYKYEASHNIDAYRKSYYKECIGEFKKDFEKTLYCKFRTPNSVQRVIFSFYMLAKKKCILKDIRLWSRKSQLENIYVPLSHPIKMDRRINKHKKKLKLFCINDNEKTHQEDREKLKDYLEFLFPKAQEWEKTI
ncbi:MAG: Stealth CR1 domain-containing protein [Candidatus Gastranaerophilaceae bacterium]